MDPGHTRGGARPLRQERAARPPPPPQEREKGVAEEEAGAPPPGRSPFIPYGEAEDERRRCPGLLEGVKRE